MNVRSFGPIWIPTQYISLILSLNNRNIGLYTYIYALSIIALFRIDHGKSVCVLHLNIYVFVCVFSLACHCRVFWSLCLLGQSKAVNPSSKHCPRWSFSFLCILSPRSALSKSLKNMITASAFSPLYTWYINYIWTSNMYYGQRYIHNSLFANHLIINGVI